MNDARLLSVVERLRRFTLERDWAQFHDPKNLAMLVGSEAGELLAELRWVPNESSDDFVHDPANRERIEREAADVGISLLLFCDRAGIDLVSAIERKIEVNANHYPAVDVRGKSERPERRGQ